MLEALSDNVEGTILSTLINVCHYITEFISAAGDSGLNFSVKYLLLKLQVWWMMLVLIFHNCAFYSEYHDTILVLKCWILKPKWLIYMVNYYYTI